MGGTSEYEGCITEGPWGGSQGKQWVYRPEHIISKISVNYGKLVNSINFQTICCKGDQAQGSSFGGSGGDQTDTISLQHPNEYLVSLSGTFGSYDGSYSAVDVIKSICFKTNIKCYGPYGGDNRSGTAFSLAGKGGVIVGFHGRIYKRYTSNYNSSVTVYKYLAAIGVYVMPKLLALGPNSTYAGKLIREPSSSLSGVEMPREVGPWGAGGGKPWDDGVFASVKQVYVHVGELNMISALQFEYLKKDGKSAISHIHGGTYGVKKIQVVNLDGEEEFLMGVSGFFGPVEGHNGLKALASVSFHTNKRIHGPYGEEKGAGYYSSTTSSGKIVGFHGMNNGFVSAIGVHMEYF
ncbi:hypothetical protein QVD17_16025 [Tagetes erecta]|uniref:Jacalin-type lectin domain-containing protein n=1 Tax=Tagetes erecta TaxID=13708 RepID=A0AAD8KQQ7_TARER|nr:hypothetical protein QVD17_16025 [Tagetes erecta]